MLRWNRKIEKFRSKKKIKHFSVMKFLNVDIKKELVQHQFVKECLDIKNKQKNQKHAY